jgi:hypothetical protein
MSEADVCSKPCNVTLTLTTGWVRPATTTVDEVFALSGNKTGAAFVTLVVIVGMQTPCEYKILGRNEGDETSPGAARRRKDGPRPFRGKQASQSSARYGDDRRGAVSVTNIR